MAEDTSPILAIFGSTLLDASGQPNLVIDSSQGHVLIWTLSNNQDKDLVVTPFVKGQVGPDQYHFLFEFGHGALTRPPALAGWDVYPVSDGKGGIKSLYVALSGSPPLRICGGGHNAAMMTYTSAIQEDAHNPKLSVSLTTGQRVTLGGDSIPGRPLGLTALTLVQANTPALSAPPLAVDFVGRRTVLNDGTTANSFTFALTNMTTADLALTPDVTFTVWFDAAPNDQSSYPWALARIEDLAAKDFIPTPSSDWKFSKPPTLLDQAPVSPQWQINPARDLVLKRQDPVRFTFSGLKSNLDPGFARMYLRFDGLPGFVPGVLSAALEKTPLPYGATRGQGLYLLAGIPKGNTPPAPDYANGLHIEQLGDGAAAIFNGGRVGIGTGTTTPAAKLEIVDPNQGPNGGTLILGSGKAEDPSLRFGCQPGYAWIQSHAGKPLAINPIPRNVGIGTDSPGSALSVAGNAAIGQTYAKNTTIAANNLAVEGKVGIGTDSPGSALSVAGNAAIGQTYAKNTTIAANNLAVEGKVGIGTDAPGSALSVAGNAAIGQTYAKNTTIAANNLAVEGSVAVGTTAPSAMLQVGDNSSAPILFGNVTTVGILQRPTDSVGLSVRNVGNAVLQFCTYDQGMKNVAANYIQMEKATGDILIGNTNAQTRVSAGKVTAPGLALNGGQTIAGKNMLEFGFGVSGKEVSAGKIGYQVWSDGLDIVGAGTTAGSRQVNLFDQVYVHGAVWMVIPDGGGGSHWCSLAANDNVVKVNNYNYAVFVNNSDARLKTSITRLDSPLARLRQLNGCRYEWTADALSLFTRECGAALSAGPGASAEETEALRRTERDKARKHLARPQVGVIAQEVEAVLPEAVATGEDGYKSVNYSQLIALLIEAVKEQDQAIAAQAARTERQQLEIDRLKQLVNGLLAETATRVTR